MSELDSIFSDDWGDDHRSGMVAVVGRPNVGKSTLINAILGQKIAIVTSKPQTTRQRQLGIYTTADAQVIFVDTPGIHDPQSRLGDFMVRDARRALRDADVILWIVDISRSPNDEDRHIADLLERIVPESQKLLVLNKIDRVNEGFDRSSHRALSPTETAIETSAITGYGVQALLDALLPLLPLGPRYYPEQQASASNMRFLAAEIIREKIIELTSEELPYAVAVEITRFRERNGMSAIDAVIYVERNSQKGMIIGKGGRMIKQIGTQARISLEAQLDTPVRLDTRVKVLKNWRSNDEFMRRVGYALSGRKRK